MHLDDERGQRWLDGQLSEPDARAAGAHLEQCEACRAAVERDRADSAEIAALLARLDAPVPAVDPRLLTERARTSPGRTVPPWNPALRWAAGLLLVLGLGALAYALPGSPLRAWMTAIAERARPGADESAPPPSESDAPPAGLAVDPGDELTIVFEGAAPGSLARVRIVEDRTVQVSSPTGTATFSSTPGQVRVAVVAQSRSTFDVRVPRTARRVTILAGNREALVIVNGRATGGESDSAGGYRIPLAP